MFDLLVAEFKDRIIAEINNSNLPPTAIAYVLQDVSQQVSTLVQQQIQAQRQERDKQQTSTETATTTTE